MRKGKNVIGQSVVSLEDGRKIDSVKDLLINERNDAVVGLLVDEGGLLSSSRVVPIEGVHAFGRDAVVIESAHAVISASADPEIKAIINRNEQLLNKRVLTNTGDKLGQIADMYFEERNGHITGFEVSGGMLGDIARGTSHLPVHGIQRMGPDVIFVTPETGADLTNQVGGFEGAMNEAGSKLNEAGGKLGEATDKASARAQAALNEREPEKSLIGRRAGSDVADQDGSIVVANGQRITAEHVEWAKRTDNMAALSRAAGSGQMSDAGDRAGAGLEAAGDNVSSMWDRFTQRISEMRDEDGKRVAASQVRVRLSQISDAIGRPVGKVILDRSDNVILDFGDIITHQAIQQADEAGMLDTLLGSVYRAEFGLPMDQLRANQPASASVQKAHGGASLVDELEQEAKRTEEERTQREQRARQEAQQAREQRDRERDERARKRDEQEAERQREIDAAKGTGASASNGAGSEPDSAEVAQAGQPSRLPEA